MRPVLAGALSCLAIVLGTAGCGGTIQATRDFSLSAPWESYERIVVRTRNGGVELASADVPEIRIRGQKRVNGGTHAEAEARLDDLEIVARRDETGPGTYLVELRVPEALAQCSPGASFTIQVPKPCRAEIHSSNGSIKVGQLKDHVVLGSSNGGITVKAVDGAVQAQTSNGSIDVEAVRGDLTAETSNGRVTSHLLGVPLELKQHDRHLLHAILNGGGSGEIHAETSNGSITIGVR